MNAVVVGIFFSVMLVMGVLSMRRVKGMAGYSVADRQAGSFMLTGSLLATVIGGSSTVGLAGLGYDRGLVGAWWLLVGVFGLTILALVFARRVRETGAYTLPEILEHQYGGKSARLAASLLIVIAWLGIIAAQMIAAGKILSVLWPGQFEILTIGSALVFIIYTALGGQYSILRTDSVQAIIIAAGLALCLYLGISTAGGVATFQTALPDDFLSFPVSPAFGWRELLIFVFFVGATYLVGPDIYARILSSRNAATAQRGLLAAAVGLVFVAFAVVFIGMLARVLLPDIPPESALPSLIMEVVPLWLSGLVVAAMLAAIMSSADSCLLTAGTIITSDIIGGTGRKKPKDATMLLLARIAVVVVGIISLGIALAMGGVIASLILAYTVYSAGLVIPVIFGFYRRYLGLNAQGAIAAIAGGGLTGGVLKVTGGDDFLLLALLLSVVLLFGVSYGSRYFSAERSSPDE